MAASVGFLFLPGAFGALVGLSPAASAVFSASAISWSSSAFGLVPAAGLAGEGALDDAAEVQAGEALRDPEARSCSCSRSWALSPGRGRGWKGTYPMLPRYSQ